MGKPSVYFFLRELGFGGTETYLADLLPLLASEFEIHLVVASSSASPLERQLQDQCVQLHAWPFDAENRFRLGEARRLARDLAQWRPGIVHTVSLTFHALARAAAILAGTGALVTDYRNAFARKFAKRPYLRCEPALRSATDALLFASPALITDYLQYWKLPPENTALPHLDWHQGIRPDRFKPQTTPAHSAEHTALERELNLPAGRRFIGIVARFHPQKRHDIFFSMARDVAVQIPSAEFLIIGDGEPATREAYEAQVKALGIAERVHFLGRRADIPALLRSLDLFLLCSDYEGLSRSMLEAMASGIPVIISRSAETTGALRDGVDAAIVAAQDPALYAHRVIELLQNEPLRQRLALAAPRATQAFSINASADKLSAIYYEILNPSTRPARRKLNRALLRACPFAMHLQKSK